jgi:hypothetical protein
MATLQAADANNATTLDGSTTSATLELFRSALGPLNPDYYLKAFTRFDAADSAGPSWNWSACLCTLNWMAYRQLWGAALAYTGALLTSALLIFGIGRLVFQFSMEVQMGLLAVLVGLAFVLPGLFGNALLYAACRKKMEHALSVNATVEDACAMLKRSASSRQRLIGLGIGNAVLLGAVVGGYIAFPDAAQRGTETQKGTQTQSPGQARNAAAGKAVDLAVLPATATSAPASSPAATASATPAPPAPQASAASLTAAVALAPSATESKPAVLASAPLAAASAPVAAASAPLIVASAPGVAIPAVAALATASAPQEKPTQKAKAANATSQASDKPKAAASRAKPAQASVGKGAASAAEKNVRFLVNVGLFADENNTRNAYTKLNDAGLNVLSNEVSTKKGKLTRIRVGPFATQAEAERAAEKIRGLKLDAVVVSQ